MTTLVRPHTILLNVALNQATAALQMGAWAFAVKQFLCGQAPVDPVGAYVVRASSNGVVATTADNWTTAADCVGAAIGVAHSWILLEDPNGVQVLIDLTTSSTVNEFARVTWARPDQQFSTAGLVTTAAPAAPANALTQTTEQYRQVLENQPSLFNHSLNMWRDALGSFVIGTGRSGQGLLASCIAFFVLDPTDAEVAAYPFWAHQVYVSSTGGAFGRGAFDNGSSYSSANSWWSDGTSVAMIIDQRNVASQAGASGTTGGRLVRHRLEMWNNTSGRVAYRGSVPDFGILAGSPTSNDLEPGADAVRRISLGVIDVLTLGATTITL